MMYRILSGIVCGLIAGIIDLIPMFIQNLTWDANLSALSMWIIIGFFIATSKLQMNSIIKGIIISFLCIIPCSFIIGWKEPVTLIPIFIMTLILGGLLGFVIHRIDKMLIRKGLIS
ncbi:MAG: hypothetical protein NT175_04450 [Bacteroidetes bacterium]|nr:hypothetical protein [Bacteroidota bacterium]